MNFLTGLSVLGAVVDNPDNPTNGNPDAMVVAGERIEPEDVDVDDTQADLEDDDTPVEDTDSSQGGDDIDYKQRISDAARAIKAEKERADALAARIKRLEDGGINLAEIEALLPKDSSQPAQQEDVVTKADLARMSQGFQFTMARSQFISKNAEFEDGNLSELLDMNVIKLLNQDKIAGLPPRRPDELYASAAKNVKALISSFEKKGKQKATQQRQKIKSQASDMGGQSDKRSKSDADEETFDPRSSYVNAQKNP